MGFNRHIHPPPPPPNFKDLLNEKEKRYKKREKYMKVRDKGGGGYLLTYLGGWEFSRGVEIFFEGEGWNLFGNGSNYFCI